MLATFLVGVLLATPGRGEGVGLLLETFWRATAARSRPPRGCCTCGAPRSSTARAGRSLLRGVAFGNEVWANVRLPRRHHDETDYQRVAAMGMNAVRFYMNYRTFEADAAPGQYLDDGWQWLDDNIAWAKRHGVYLILNMHVPPGGFQSLGNGKALWDRPEMQERYLALWTAIARHCKDEPTVAGYDLLNEPVVTRAASQWRELAGRAAVAIRAVDPDHMLFVERLNSIAGDWSEDADRGFFRIADPNTVYEFHFYKPFHFTHQSASWVPFTAENVRYPDTRAEVEWFLLDRKAGTEDSPKLPPGDSPWTFYPGAPFKVDDRGDRRRQAAAGREGELGQGLVRRPDAGRAGRRRQGQARDLGEEPDRHARLVLLEQGRQGGRGAIRKRPRRRRVDRRGRHGGRRQPGRRRASLPDGAGRDVPAVGLDARREDPADRDLPDPAGLLLVARARARRAIARSSSRRSTPTSRGASARRCRCSSGEWGAIRYSFDEDRGGLRWVTDMLDIMRARKLSFTYHTYHEDGFGIYRGAGSAARSGARQHAR